MAKAKADEPKYVSETVTDPDLLEPGEIELVVTGTADAVRDWKARRLLRLQAKRAAEAQEA